MNILGNLAAMIALKKVHHEMEKKLKLKVKSYKLVCIFVLDQYYADVLIDTKVRRYPIDEGKKVIGETVKMLAKKELSSNEVLDGIEIDYCKETGNAKAKIYHSEGNVKGTKTIEL